ncbi:MAG: glycosyltransferase [Bacteroidota bacterium]|nr:glycosyltransferase [Bacteroidota bacterium]
MIRICNTLSAAGHQVILIGVKFGDSPSLEEKKYEQKRVKVFRKKGFGFYFEYNMKLFFFLLLQKADIFCCIDLDTMLPVYFISVLKNRKRVYDAHEYFSEQKEILTRRNVYRFWHFIEKRLVPKFQNGYTVSEGIAKEFKKKYGVDYAVIRNMPLLKPLTGEPSSQKNILYRGSVNEGRGFEYLIPAMKNVDAHLFIYGDGNFLAQAKSLVKENQLDNKIFFKGKVLPNELDKITRQSFIGINLVEPIGANQVLSLANKFFDYMQNGIPQVTMNFPEYKKINEAFEVAVLIDELSVTSIEKALNRLLQDEELYFRLKQNCLKARDVYNWQNEEMKLLGFYNQFNKINTVNQQMN